VSKPGKDFGKAASIGEKRVAFSMNTNVASLQHRTTCCGLRSFQNDTINQVTSGPRIINSGYDNSGYDNSGYDNSGCDNSGYDNSRYDNSYNAARLASANLTKAQMQWQAGIAAPAQASAAPQQILASLQE
jgi:hypothetical protein